MSFFISDTCVFERFRGAFALGELVFLHKVQRFGLDGENLGICKTSMQ
jgi:hypothetical protein